MSRTYCPEVNARRSAALKGRKVSDETRAKISAAKRGKPTSEAAKQKLRLANLGRKHSDDAKAKIGAAGKGRRPSVSACTLESLKAMIECRGVRLNRYLAEHPEAEASRRAKISATRRAKAQSWREERAQEEATKGSFARFWRSLSPGKRAGLIQNWNAPHDANGRKLAES